MTTFEHLPLGPETVAALAAEGMEVPTPFQSAAIPVIARGNDLIGRAGPGSGTLVAYGAPLIERIEGGTGSPACLVLCTGHRQATELARSLATLCDSAGLRAGALAPHWNHPELADILFVPADRLSALYDGTVRVDAVRTVVFHDGDGLVKSVPADRLEALLTGLPSGCQRIFCGLPFGPGLSSLARRFTSKAVTIPPGDDTRRPSRKKSKPVRDLHFSVTEGDDAEAALALVSSLLGDSTLHVLLYTASADQAADLGDFLAVHGYASGPPGDATAPVWLCPGEEDGAREVLEGMHDPSRVATVSCGVPPGTESARTRHCGGGPAWALPAVRELGHLRQVASDAGLKLKRIRPDRPKRVSGRLDELADRLHEAARAPEATPYYLLVESLLERFTAAEVAAAALLLLDRDSGGKPAAMRGGSAAGAAVPESWVRLFVSAGQRDELGPGDILGAITNESGLDGKRVGRIDVRESHSLVEVYQSDAKKVIGALNGTTLGGRSLRVDYDRAKDRRPGGKPSGGPSRPGRGPSRPSGRPSRPGRGPSGGPGRSRPPKPTFRRGASGSSDRGRNRPRRTGQS